MKKWNAVMLLITFFGMGVAGSAFADPSSTSPQAVDTTTQTKQAEQLMATVVNITTVAGKIASSNNGDYSTVTADNITKMAGANTLDTPWGAATVTPSAKTYSVSLPSVPVDICNQAVGLLKKNPSFTNFGACDGSALTYTFDISKQSASK